VGHGIPSAPKLAYHVVPIGVPVGPTGVRKLRKLLSNQRRLVGEPPEAKRHRGFGLLQTATLCGEVRRSDGKVLAVTSRAMSRSHGWCEVQRDPGGPGALNVLPRFAR
jgi:hypothetical protein